MKFQMLVTMIVGWFLGSIEEEMVVRRMEKMNWGGRNGEDGILGFLVFSSNTIKHVCISLDALRYI